MSRVLDLFWWLSVFTVGALSLLLLWSLVGEITLPIRLEGLRGFSIATGEKFSMELPVALEGPSTDLATIHADYRFPSQPGAFVPVSLAILSGLMLLISWMLDQLRKIMRTIT